MVNFIFGKSSNLGNGQGSIEWNNSHDIYIIRKIDRLSKCYSSLVMANVIKFCLFC